MDEIDILFNNLFNKKNISKFDVKFVVHQFDGPMIISGDIYELVSEEIGSPYLFDLLDEVNYKRLPKEHGIYSADLCVHTFQCNNYDDPVEWDIKIWLENIKLEMSL